MPTLQEILMSFTNNLALVQQSRLTLKLLIHSHNHPQKKHESPAKCFFFFKCSYLQNKFLINEALCNAGLKVWIL